MNTAVSQELSLKHTMVDATLLNALLGSLIVSTMKINNAMTDTLEQMTSFLALYRVLRR